MQALICRADVIDASRMVGRPQQSEPRLRLHVRRQPCVDSVHVASTTTVMRGPSVRDFFMAAPSSSLQPR